MQILRLAVTGTAVLILAGCDGSRAVAPEANTRTVHSPTLANADAGPVATTGRFDAFVDFSTLTLTPRGENCLLSVKGQLVFHGTIEGAGTGHTDALVFATCDEVASRPPGTDADVFHSELAFAGTIAGDPATAKVIYQGRTQPGGHIDAHLHFSNGASGVLNTSGQVAVGGSYEGSLVVH